MAAAALTVTGAVRRYPGADTPALDGVDLTLRQGEVLAVLGPSGGGKSTLLRAVAGLEPLDAGAVAFADPDERLAMVFQQAALFPWLSVRENIALGGRYRRNGDRFTAAHVDELLEILDLAGHAAAAPDELSGGQAQRVAVGRALAVRPDILLLDEPFSALDPALRGGLRVWLRGLIERLGLTAMVVTHDVDEALALGDRIGFFAGPSGFSHEWAVADGVTAEDILAHYTAGGAGGARRLPELDMAPSGARVSSRSGAAA